MIRAILIAAALTLAAGAASAKPMLDAKGVCRDGGKFAPASACAPPAAAAKAGAPNCKKGKPCGNSCIAKDKVCHIK